MKSIKLLLVFYILSLTIVAQNKNLQSGPMLGYSQMREVAIWIQTKEEAKVKVNFWEKGSTNKKSTSDKKTKAKKAFATTIIVKDLEPGKIYEYEVVIDKEVQKFDYPLEFQTQKLWQWRENASSIKFVIASCFYVNEEQYDRPGTPYGGDFEILDVLYDKNPEFMVWMGDNTYLREADWFARSSIIKRYTHTRSYKGLQKILGSTHHYATWDDHDYGPNDSDRGFPLKETTKEVFDLFWANPTSGLNGEGITTHFQWADVDFFLLDDRFFRSPKRRNVTTEKEIIGNEQLEWLIDNLTSSYAPFKFVVIGTQFLNPNAGGENHSMYPKEREKILEYILKEKIPGVIFLTGDVHRTEVTKIEREKTYPLYDITISPLTAGSSRRVYDNAGRIDSTLVTERNFGLFEITGERNNRVLNVKSFNYMGEQKWEMNINENELK